MAILKLLWLFLAASVGLMPAPVAHHNTIAVKPYAMPQYPQGTTIKNYNPQAAAFDGADYWLQ